jgi:hypothetical protein
VVASTVGGVAIGTSSTSSEVVAPESWLVGGVETSTSVCGGVLDVPARLAKPEKATTILSAMITEKKPQTYLMVFFVFLWNSIVGLTNWSFTTYDKTTIAFVLCNLPCQTSIASGRFSSWCTRALSGISLLGMSSNRSVLVVPIL